MLNCKDFYDLLKNQGVDWYTGVPDSLLKDFCAYVQDHGQNIITANEGGSIGLASGYHLATNKIPAVYMQNSGFGNIINPLTSLVDPEVYAIPMLLIVGWRGESGVKDEPQHVKQGRINESLLNSLEVPYEILSNDIEVAQKQLDKAFKYMNSNSAPFALLVKKNTFEKYSLQDNGSGIEYPMSREKALEIILDQLNDDDVVVSTTGKASREIFEIRDKYNDRHDRDFLTVGSMGHASQIALGIALSKNERRVICVDGDGAVLMHMGSNAIIGNQAPKNFRHIVLNNGCHDSVGGQPTVGFETDFCKIFEGCGYKTVSSTESESDLKSSLAEFLLSEGPSMLEVKIAKGARKDLGRPTIKPVDNKRDFMKNLKK